MLLLANGKLQYNNPGNCTSHILIMSSFVTINHVTDDHHISITYMISGPFLSCKIYHDNGPTVLLGFSFSNNDLALFMHELLSISDDYEETTLTDMYNQSMDIASKIYILLNKVVNYGTETMHNFRIHDNKNANN